MTSPHKKALHGRSFLSIADVSPEELEFILETARVQKKRRFRRSLRGKNFALLFEKPSLRTKVSFDVAITQLGGHSVYLGQNEVGLGQRESIADVARTLSRYVQGIVARVFAHQSLIELAKHAGVPVINALSDVEHPCQALADFLTIQEHKKTIRGLRIVYVGDGNNIAASLAQGAVMLGAHFVIASPKEYELPEATVRTARGYTKTGGSFSKANTPEEAVRGADVVYTDVWTSMGDEPSRQRTSAFKGYQVTSKLMALAKPDAIFMHDLPAHRGEEVVDEVIDGPQSVVFDQAENRLHAQRALLHLVLGSRTIQ
ncbi:ornithine carbamoyltransferase [Candidatus Kaiserbacteria bacterium RIFCSPLOWO2_01_FULL_54_20]|uniref:Ornithine carbamoyltransferase n=1 Tax=Candidatus Kaiserbacteria bacterium RIFCSPLOWO2_01_FULL_54_20 TaxID=1798513 RepID=A0A1F6EJU5_9BACT|nr:MAG: ornithine carbamoyltransferase [Candidatus Kaiserbacteria bacterium RIFCSPLOWO2_01_FULL_54_20]